MRITICLPLIKNLSEMNCGLWQKRQKKTAKQMSEKLSNICSEINQTDMKLSSIKQDLSQMKQSVRINYLHKGSMTGIVDTLANIQVSGGQEPQSGDNAVCGLNKADKTCDTNQSINDSREDKTEQECDQLVKWITVVRKKRCCHKSGNAPDAKFKTVEIFVSRLKPDTRIVYLKNGFVTSSRMQEVCGFKH